VTVAKPMLATVSSPRACHCRALFTPLPLVLAAIDGAEYGAGNSHQVRTAFTLYTDG
jgi:hypothetical protein